MRRPRLGNTALGELVEIKPTIIEEEQLDNTHIDKFVGGLSLAEDPAKMNEKEFLTLAGYLHRNDILVPKGLLSKSVFPSKPNALKILGLDSVLRYDGTIDILRYTSTTVHRISLGAWVAVAGPALTGGLFDRFTTILIENRIFFNNHGVNVLMEVNTAANTYAAAGNSRQYKYYVVANNRILAAHLLGGSPQPLEVAGCGNLNYVQWDPAVDISAFRNVLVDAEETDSDEITGMVALKDNVILFRRRSIWIGVPQEIASAPFKWFKLFSGLGCTAEHSIRRCGDDTVIWLDPYTNNFYFWKLGMEAPEAIGDKVIDDVLFYIRNFHHTYSSWDSLNDIYEIYLEPTPQYNAGRCYQYNKKYKAWTCDHTLNYLPSAVSNGVLQSATGTFDQLVGSFDNLTGTYDGLSDAVSTPSKIYGASDGEVWSEIGTPPSSSVNDLIYSTELKTKVFTYHTNKIGLMEVIVDIDVFELGELPTHGSLIIEIFKDKRDFFINGKQGEPIWTFQKFLPILQIGRQKLKFRRHFSCETFYIKILGNGNLGTWWNFLGIRIKTVKEGAE